MSKVSLLDSACHHPRLAGRVRRAPQPKGEVLVYVAVPLSGFQANGGQTVLGGANLMASRINRAGGLLGYTVKVVGLDDESDSDVAVDVATRIKDDIAAGKKVLAVIGHLNSGQTLAAMEIYKDLSLLVITPTSSEVSLTQEGLHQLLPRQRQRRDPGQGGCRVPGEHPEGEARRGGP